MTLKMKWEETGPVEDGRVTAGEGRGVVYFGAGGRFRLFKTGGLRLMREGGVGCSLMGVALSVGWVE